MGSGITEGGTPAQKDDSERADESKEPWRERGQ